MDSFREYSRVAIVAATAVMAVACGDPVLDRQTREALPAAVDGATKDVGADVAAVVRTFYERRQWAPAWTDDDRVERLEAILTRVSAHGLDPEAYGASRLLESWAAARDVDAPKAERAAALASFDASATTALAAASHDVAVGRVAPDVFDRDWSAYRELPDLAAALESDVSNAEAWLGRVAPRHEGYARLQRAYEQAVGRREADANLERMAVNLDRWRWLPDDLGATHLIVNIPEFRLRAIEHGRTAVDMRVVVGKPGANRTPVFSDELESVVFNPYWNIPESILTAETAPAVLDEGDYLARNGMEVLRVSASGARHIDPDDVDWDDPGDLDSVRVRQRPGAGNALGQVKFLFPNPHAVYLHDTPAKALFAREVRAFSHGCVRLEDPHGLAAWLLRDQATWTASKIAATIDGDDETPVSVDQPVGIHIVYFTVVVGDDGEPIFLEDVYGADARQARATRR